MIVNEMPFKLPSKLFRGTMPFEIASDPRIIGMLKAYQVKQVVLLCPDYESQFATTVKLKEHYAKNGIKVIYFPIEDHRVPYLPDLRGLVKRLHADLTASDQNNTVVHCLGGKGRTGLVIACLARKIFNLNGDQAIEWTRAQIPKSIEGALQEKMVKDFIPEAAAAAASPEEPGVPEELKLVEIPLGLPGKIFKWQMPVGIAAKQSIMDYLKFHDIKQVVMLCTEQEYRFHTQTELRGFYEAFGIKTVFFPIQDGQVPSMEAFQGLVDRLLHDLSSKDKVHTAVHCVSGKGRTGLLMACMARRILEADHEFSLSWVRSYIPNALDSEVQQQFLKSFH